MEYQIFLRGKEEDDEIIIDENEYNEIVKILNRVKLFRLKDGMVINSVDIKKIKPCGSDEQIKPLQDSYKLPWARHDDKPEKRIKVLGGWQTINVREGMSKLFDQLKSKGRFKDYKDYSEWEKATYKEQPEAK